MRFFTILTILAFSTPVSAQFWDFQQKTYEYPSIYPYSDIYEPASFWTLPVPADPEPAVLVETQTGGACIPLEPSESNCPDEPVISDCISFVEACTGPVQINCIGGLFEERAQLYMPSTNQCGCNPLPFPPEETFPTCREYMNACEAMRGEIFAWCFTDDMQSSTTCGGER